jgi:hypothetical protein
MLRLEANGALDALSQTNDFKTFVSDHDESADDSWSRYDTIRERLEVGYPSGCVFPFPPPVPGGYPLESNTMGRLTLEQQTMNAGVAKLMPLFSAHGFILASSDTGISSGGRFATATFRKGNLQIGLIVRFGSELGCPNYSERNGYADHGGLISTIDPGAEPRLVPNGPISYRAVDSGDPFDALMDDLEQTILPALKRDPAGFSMSLAQAHGRFQRQLKGGG